MWRSQISFPCRSQHWIANNLFGLAFSLNGVELLHLNNVSTGCILLGGLFIYDVFWVSGRVPLGATLLGIRIATFSAHRGVVGMRNQTVAERGSAVVNLWLGEPRAGRDLLGAAGETWGRGRPSSVFPTKVFPVAGRAAA